MTTNDTIKILTVLKAAYPSFYRGMEKEELTGIVSLWQSMFADDEYQAVDAAVRRVIATQQESFPPSIGAVLVAMYDNTQPEMRTGMDAAMLVMKAIGNSSYNNVEEWNKLPPDVQACVTPEQLRLWAMTEDLNMDVVMSNVQRAYLARQKNQRTWGTIPGQLKDQIAQIEKEDDDPLLAMLDAL